MATIEMRELVRLHGRQVILDDISLTIPEGSVTALLGDERSGKMTVLRCIAGVEKLDHGTVSIGGKAVDRLKAGRRDVAMIFHDQALLPHASVRENIALPLKFAKVGKREARDRVAAVAERLGLEDVLDRKPKDLSDEQRLGTGVARALVRRPGAYLVQDAPAGADAALHALIRHEIVRLHREDGATVLFATSDGHGAREIADRAAVLDEGRLVQAGTMAAVYDRPASLGVAALFGEPGFNLFPAKVSALGDGEVTLKLKGGASVTATARDDELEVGEIVKLGIWPDRMRCEGEGILAARVVGRSAENGGEVVDLESRAGPCRLSVPAGSIEAGLSEVRLGLPGEHCRLFDDHGAAIG